MRVLEPYIVEKKPFVQKLLQVDWNNVWKSENEPLFEEFFALKELYRRNSPIVDSVEFLSVPYIAGYADAEGSFSVINTSSCRVAIAQNTLAVLNNLKQTYGGNIYKKGVTGHEWVASSVEAKSFLQDIVPHLIGKQEQARLILEERNSSTIKEYLRDMK